MVRMTAMSMGTPLLFCDSISLCQADYSKRPENGEKSEKSVGQGLFFLTVRGTIKRYDIFLWIKK